MRSKDLQLRPGVSEPADKASSSDLGEPPDALGAVPTYAIGYGKPPTGARFAPGRSGNPNGRPRKDPAFKALLERELAERVVVKEQGHRRKLSKRSVIVKRLVSEAMAGNPKHFAIVLSQDPVAAEVLGEVTAALSRPADDSVKVALVERLRAAVAMADAHHPSADDPDAEPPNPVGDPDLTGVPRDPTG